MTGGAGPWLLAVDGIDGSGKSSFAACLVAALGAGGIETVLLRVDDFRRPVEWQRPGRTEADAYHDDYYDLDGLGAALRALLAGAEEIAVPSFDANLDRRTGVRGVGFRGEGRRAVVVEGVFALRVDVVRAQAIHVYLSTMFSEAQRRILARDTARGRSPDEVVRRIANRYFPSQERYLRDHDPVGRAHVLVDHDRLGAPVLQRLDAARLSDAGVEGALRHALADFAAPSAVK